MKTERNAKLRKNTPAIPGSPLELKGVYLLLEKMSEQLQIIGEQIIHIHSDNAHIMRSLECDEDCIDREWPCCDPSP